MFFLYLKMQISTIHCRILKTLYASFSFWVKQAWSFIFLYYLNYIRGSAILFYVSYKHSQTMYIVPMERVWKDNSNPIKFSTFYAERAYNTTLKCFQYLHQRSYLTETSQIILLHLFLFRLAKSISAAIFQQRRLYPRLLFTQFVSIMSTILPLRLIHTLLKQVLHDETSNYFI